MNNNQKRANSRRSRDNNEENIMFIIKNNVSLF